MELISIGKILKTHGYKGNLKIFVEDVYMDDFENLDVLFIDQLPFFITSKDIISDTAVIISLDGIENKEQAQELQSKSIYAPKDKISGKLVEIPFHEILGFTMQDKNYGIIGTIEEILEFPHQYMAKILKDKKEILIPLNDQFIKKTDPSSQTVEMELPEGFLEIF